MIMEKALLDLAQALAADPAVSDETKAAAAALARLAEQAAQDFADQVEAATSTPAGW